MHCVTQARQPRTYTWSICAAKHLAYCTALPQTGWYGMRSIRFAVSGRWVKRPGIRFWVWRKNQSSTHRYSTVHTSDTTIDNAGIHRTCLTSWQWKRKLHDDDTCWNVFLFCIKQELSYCSDGRAMLHKLNSEKMEVGQFSGEIRREARARDPRKL